MATFDNILDTLTTITGQVRDVQVARNNAKNGGNQNVGVSPELVVDQQSVGAPDPRGAGEATRANVFGVAVNTNMLAATGLILAAIFVFSRVVK